MSVSRQERSLSTCDRVREWLPEYDYGGPGFLARRQVARHLARCSECREELEALRRATAVLSALPEAPAPEGMWERLEGAMHRADRAAARPARRAPALVAAAVAAALAVGLGLGTRARDPGGDPIAHAAPYVRSHLALSRTGTLGAGAGVDAMVLLTTRRGTR